MKRCVIDSMFSLLRYEVCFGEELSEAERTAAKEELGSLYTLAKAHDMEHLVADALSLQGLLDGDDEYAKKFQKAQMLALFRYERINYDYLAICKLFEQEGVVFLPLKGAIIRDFYPQAWMRTSCDVDILIKEEDIERASELLQKRLSFTLGARNYHDVSLFSPSGVHLELHFSIQENKEQLDRVLSRVWEYVNTARTAEYRQEMSNEFFMLHHITHMAYHFVSGGCGIKPFMDLAVMRERVTFDTEKFKALCDECELWSFYENVMALTDVWFGRAEHTSVTERMQSYLLLGGVYGTVENKVAANQVKKSGKLGYMLGRIFPSKEQLSVRYPTLKRRGWLLPIYHVRRWFEIIFCGRLKHSMRELQVSSSVSADKVQATKALFDEIGLK